MLGGALHGRMAGLMSLWAFLVVIWLACAGAVAPESVATGAAIGLIIAVFVVSRTAVWNDAAFSPRRAVALARFFGAFLVALARSNLAVLRLVYAPMPRLRPAVATIPTGLTSPIGRLALTHAITLTPGSLSLELTDDGVRVHMLDAAPDAMAQAQADVSAGLERHLANAFG